jgi:hypothetical protein
VLRLPRCTRGLSGVVAGLVCWLYGEEVIARRISGGAGRATGQEEACVRERRLVDGPLQ